MGDDPRLAAAGARQHEQGAIAGRHGFTLRGVQIVEEMLQVGGHDAIVPDEDKVRASGQTVTSPARH